MFQTTKIQECLKNLIGWSNHYDLIEVPALNIELNKSDSGEYYQDYHPALRLDLIKTTLPVNRTLDSYLQEKVKVGISQLANDVFVQKKLNEFSRELLANGDLINGYGWKNDVIINESRFVGVAIKVLPEIGVKISINKLGFQFTMPQTDLDIYVYHSSEKEPLQIIPYTTAVGLNWGWLGNPIELGFEDDRLQGGEFIIGYYQDDITGQAIQYKKLDWESGYCSSCQSSKGDSARWKSITKYIEATPFYVPNGSLEVDKTMFDMDDAFQVYDNNFGMNFNVSARCDLSDFLCDQKALFRTALGLKVTHLILRDMKFSQQINYVEENLKSLIIRDLEGDKDTNYVNIVTKLSRAIKAIDVDTNMISKVCLPCTKKNSVTYDVA